MFPVIDAGRATPLSESPAPLIDHGAEDVVAFRRNYLRENVAQPRSELPFDRIAEVVKAQFRPAWAESEALAEALELDVSAGELLAYSGFSDFIDLLGVDFEGEIGCTAIAVSARDGGGSGESTPVIAQTWDYKQFYRDHSLLVRRRPQSGLDSVSLTTSLGHAYMGINEAGVGVLINNLQSAEAQVGLPFSAVVHALLHRAETATEARDVLAELPIMSSHNYLIADEQDAFNVEAGGGILESTPVDEDPWVHTNHTLHEDLAGTIRNYSASSDRRYESSLARLRAEVEQSADGAVDLETFEIPEFFADHEAPLCRHGDEPDDTATIATVWVTQDPPELHAVRGTPCDGDPKQEVTVRD